MKAEHRKELETNVLADRLGKTLQSFKEGPSRSTMLWAAGLVAILVLVFVWTVVQTQSLNTSSDLWEQWYGLDSASGLESFAKDHGNSVQGRLARFQMARLDLAGGIADLGTPALRSEALERVRKAAELYESLINESAGQPLLQQEALLNSGKAYETLEDTAKAKSSYQRLARDFPKSIAGKEAATCLERLEAGAADLEKLKKLGAETAKPAPK